MHSSFLNLECCEGRVGCYIKIARYRRRWKTLKITVLDISPTSPFHVSRLRSFTLWKQRHLASGNTRSTTMPVVKRKKHTQPHQGLSLFLSGHPTLTVSSRHKPVTKPSNEPDCGNLGPVQRGPWLDQLEYHPRGCE